MPHFFINSNQIKDNKIKINCLVSQARENSENYFHIARSLRARTGEKLLFIDENMIQYETTIESITTNEITAIIDKLYQSKRFLDFKLYLAQSPLRSDAQNHLIEKATELGVSGVYPIKTDNCALNNEMIDKKIEKWQKIMYESSKQCERANIPVCYARTSIEKVLSENNFDKVMVFCERIAKNTLKNALNQRPIKKGDKILVIIGPEGGFSQKEFDMFSQKNLQMLTLGDMILRSETATTVALGNIIYEYSNYQK